jgi:hypothetical protein
MKKILNFFGIFLIKDMEWSFNEGLHEGINRKNYKNKPNDFSKSDFHFYMKKYFTGIYK